MPISIGSAASAWLATTLNPIAPTNHRIMIPPLAFLPDLTGDGGLPGFQGLLKHDRIVLALATPTFGRAAVAGRGDHEYLRDALRAPSCVRPIGARPCATGKAKLNPSDARHASADDRP